MHINRHNPQTIHAPGPYSHTVTVTDAKLVFIAGQVALNKDGELVGHGDLRAQAVQVMENLKAILTDLNADFTNLVKLTIFVVDYQFPDRETVISVLTDYIDADHLPANTLIGIQSLARPGMMIEIEATAATNSSSDSVTGRV